MIFLRGQSIPLISNSKSNDASTFFNILLTITVFNCSQTKFVACILLMRSFYPIFHLTDVLPDPFDFSFEERFFILKI